MSEDKFEPKKPAWSQRIGLEVDRLVAEHVDGWRWLKGHHRDVPGLPVDVTQPGSYRLT